MRKASTSTNVTIRMDRETRERAELLFSELGMSMSTAFNIFVRQSLRERRIPFDVSLSVPNAETRAALAEAERLSKDPDAKGYDDLDRLFADLKS